MRERQITAVLNISDSSKSDNLLLTSATKKKEIILETFDSFKSLVILQVVKDDIQKSKTIETSELEEKTLVSKYYVFDVFNMKDSLAELVRYETQRTEFGFKKPNHIQWIISIGDCEFGLSICKMLAVHYKDQDFRYDVSYLEPPKLEVKI